MSKEILINPDTADYRCVTDIREAREYVDGAAAIAFDYETSPLDSYSSDPKAALDPGKARITGMSISREPGSAIYIPACHRNGRNMPWEDFSILLHDLLTDREIIKIAHNIAFESSFSYAEGIVIQEPVRDTMCEAQLTLKSPVRFRTLSDSGLKILAPELLKKELPSFSDVTAGRFFDELDPQDHETIRYACADSDMAYRLHLLFRMWFERYMPKHRYIAEEIEAPVAVYLGIMRCAGVPVDRKLMDERKAEAVSEMARIKELISDITGGVDPGKNCSTKAFKQFLYGKEGLPVLKTTASDKEALDDETIKLLIEWCGKNRPELIRLFELVLEYRRWGKIMSTYIDGYLKHVNSATSRIHPEFFALSTETGRMNCQRPNCQNMPRKGNDPVGVRNFIAAPEGHLIMSLDFSQIELRVGAFYCRDETMMQTYRSGGDIHAATTAVIFGVSYDEAQDRHRPEYKEQRTIAKNVNFGTFYGLFPRGLQNTLRFKAGVEKSLPECEQILNNLKRGYPGLIIWQEETKRSAARNMYTETWLGRRRYLPGIRSDNWSERSFAERCSLNTPIQGTAADILKISVTRILRGLPERPWLIPILQIHDELTFIVPDDRLGEAASFVRSCMEKEPFPGFDLPLIAEVSVGKRFGEMEDYE